MPELRKDPIVGRWVIISTQRAKRPYDFTSAQEDSEKEGPCPFCQNNESLTPPEIYSMRDLSTRPNTPGWSVRVVPAKTPFLRIEGNLGRTGVGMYDVMNGIGAHEMVIETPNHIANIADLEVGNIANVFDTYILRMRDLNRDSRFKYVLVFKNYGYSAGGSRIRHSRSQLIATPVTPKRVKEELAGAKRYFDYKERCIYCDLIKEELELQDRVIVDIDGFIAISPFAARFPFEVWIMPKAHSSDFSNTQRNEIGDLARILKLVMLKLKKALNDPPYNYILHTAPFRVSKKVGYWLTVEHDFHWHIEIIPRLTRVAGFEWGTGFYINPTLPEESAKYLRELSV